MTPPRHLGRSEHSVIEKHNDFLGGNGKVGPIQFELIQYIFTESIKDICDDIAGNKNLMT